MRLLVDTNVFLDLFYDRGELADYSDQFFASAFNHQDVIYVASTTIKDLAYFIKKSVHDDKKTNDYLIQIFRDVCKIVGVTDDDSITALYEDGDYEDNLLALTSQTSMCDAIITNNVKDFIGKNVVAWTPKEYLTNR